MTHGKSLPKPVPGRPAWAGRNYSLLTAAAVVTGLGSAGALIASAFAVLETGGGSFEVGLVAAARTVPLVVFVLVGGAVADRIPRHHVMVAANALNCLSQAVFAVLVLTDRATLWQMMLLSALGGTGQAFFGPAAEGMVLATVSGEQSGRAFAVFRMGMNGAQIAGAALGGAMVAVIGPGWVLAADAAAFALAGSLRALLDVSQVRRRAPGGRLWHDLREGWREVVSRRWLWAIVVQFSVINAVIAVAEAVYGPQVARDALGGAGSWGLALGSFGVGTVLGAVLMTRLRPDRILLLGVGCVFPCALPLAMLAVPSPLPLLVLAMAASGIAMEVFAVTWMMALHQEIPEEKFSRVSSYDWLGSLALVPLTTALAGPLEGVAGRSGALWACSALVVLLTALVLCVPEVRQLTRRTTAADTPTAPLAAPTGAGGVQEGTATVTGRPAVPE